LTGAGKRPSRTPCHHVDLLTGMGPFGAIIAEMRTKPVWGKRELDVITLNSNERFSME